MELARASLVAASAPTGYWDHAVAHAVDILNRTSCPPGSLQTSYELASGEKPSIMGIMPFGCRAYAVKPHTAVSKTRMDSRAWIGVNLGRDNQSPDAFRVLVPGYRVVVTSDVYFDETCFPWRATPTVSSHSAIPPQPAFSSGVAGLPDGTDVASSHDVRSADHVLGSARTSRRVLLLFSGPFARPDGIAAFLSRSGFDCDTIDSHRSYGGGEQHNLLRNSVYERLLQRCAAGEYAAIVASPPCSTFSVSRHFRSDASPDGGPPV
eukprot:5082338-Pleurochrysis_carterae.AAC.1